MQTPQSTASRKPHAWQFFRAGGFDQVKLQTGADLMNLDQLDQKLWVALACPTTGIEFDSKTAALIDSDGDGRIRAQELIAAIRWAGSMLKDADDLVKGRDGVALSAINEAVPEGRQILGSARVILRQLGKAEAAVITVADAAAATKSFANTVFNGDGVIIPESADDTAVQQVIREAITAVGSVMDRSGKPGIDAVKLEEFFGELTRFDAWVSASESEATKILPAGPATAAAAAAMQAVKAKIDDYFGRCRLAAFEGRLSSLLNRTEEEYKVLLTKDLTVSAQEVSGFPVSRIVPGQPLSLVGGLNPAHATAMATFRSVAVLPLLGERASLTEEDWQTLQNRLAPHAAWLGAKAGVRVETLGIARVREILRGPAKTAIAALIVRDRELEAEASGVASVEKLVRFHRDLIVLATNFVNFSDLYDGGSPAIFQAGTLYLDQRSCNLCITVADPAKHAVMASLAGAYLAYVDCVRKATGQKLTVVVIVSQGDDENLMVGRNGVFYDRKGLDYDATITKIVANPISLRQAFWLPYKRFVRWVEEQIAKRAAEADAAASQKLTAAATAVVSQGGAPAAKVPQKVDVGTVAALGVAFGAIGGFFTAVATLGKDLWAEGAFTMIGAILGVMVLISGPSLVMTYIKLRKRNLGPILDANGWAVNAKARINVPFGTRLTAIAELPPGSTRDLVDPFEETRRPWKLYLTLIVVVLLGWRWSTGKLDEDLPERLKYFHHFPKRDAAAKADPAKPETNSVPKAASAP
ncbi:MAG: hypothetical protein RIS24_2461 [Verrucomicrobiota bacterium]|jgi:hypothetical protein